MMQNYDEKALAEFKAMQQAAKEQVGFVSGTTTNGFTPYNGAPARPCPSCGHCPTCGRGGYGAYPVYPTYPYWTWTSPIGNSMTSGPTW